MAINKKLSNMIPPLIAFVVFIVGWQLIIKLLGIAPYIFPKPTDIVKAGTIHINSLMISVFTTMTEAVIGFLLSAVLGVAGAILLASSKIMVWILSTVPAVEQLPMPRSPQDPVFRPCLQRRSVKTLVLKPVPLV